MISWTANKRSAEQVRGRGWTGDVVQARTCVLLRRVSYIPNIAKPPCRGEGVGRQITNDSKRPNHLKTLTLLLNREAAVETTTGPRPRHAA